MDYLVGITAVTTGCNLIVNNSIFKITHQFVPIQVANAQHSNIEIHFTHFIFMNTKPQPVASKPPNSICVSDSIISNFIYDSYQKHIFSGENVVIRRCVFTFQNYEYGPTKYVGPHRFYIC